MAALRPDDLLARLDRRLDLLGERRGAPGDRRRTLRAAVEWSYDALLPDARRLVRHLAVLPAGATLETVEHVANGLGLETDPLELVTALVDASLLSRTETSHDARYVQLETLRAFGYDRLDHHAERDGAAELAVAWALDLVERMDAELLTPAEPYWAERIALELPNLRAARQHLLAHGRLDELVRLSTHLHEWARMRTASELWSWATELLELVPPDDERAARVNAIAALGAWRRGRFDRCRELAERAVASTDERPDDWARTRGLGELAVAMLFLGETGEAVKLWLERNAIDQHPSDLGNAAFATAYAGDIEAARERAARAREQAQRTGSPTCIAWSMYATGEVEHVAGSGEHVPWLERAVTLAASVDSDFVVGVAQVTLASTKAGTGDVAGAARTYHDLIEHWLRSGTWTQQWTTLRNSAALLEPVAPETALALIAGAESDRFSPALGPRAAYELGRLRARLTASLGDAAAAVEAEAHQASRTELAERARLALRPLMGEGAG
jgi:hypothetical protein